MKVEIIQYRQQILIICWTGNIEIVNAVHDHVCGRIRLQDRKVITGRIVQITQN